MKLKFKSGDICYSCGKRFEDVGLTKEHIPPHNLSPQSADSSFVIVPGCSDCNNSLSHEESKFRDYVVAVSAGRGSASADAAKEKMKRNFSRNEIARAGRMHKDQARLVQNMNKKHVVTREGIYLGQNTFIDVPEDLDHRAVIGKILKGLFFFHTGKVANDKFEVLGNLITPDMPKKDFYDTFRSLYTKEFGVGKTHDDFFSYSGVIINENGVLRSIWLMKFYNYARAWGSVMPIGEIS